jgi:glucose/mannose transport system substrate-binding protein
MRLKCFGIGSALAASALVCGCGSSPQATPPAKIEMFTWWVSGGESQAIAAAIKVYTDAHPGSSVLNAALANASTAMATLEMRMEAGQPPDTFQANGGADLMRWVNYGNIGNDSLSKMEDISDLAAEMNWTTAVPAAVRNSVSYNGKAYAIPLDIHRINVLFYNKKIFTDNQLTPPTTLDEFYAVGDALKALNPPIVPLAMSTQGWTVSALALSNIFPGIAGPQTYLDYWKGTGPANGPEITQAIMELQKVVSYSDVYLGDMGANQRGWDTAADQVFSGRAAMTIMGDWVSGYFASKGWVAGQDYDGIPALGSQNDFVFTTDVFGLPKGAEHREQTRELLQTFGSTVDQLTFNKIKGSIPARTDVDLSTFNAYSQRTAMQFTASDAAGTLVPYHALSVPTVYNDAVNTAFQNFVTSCTPGMATTCVMGDTSVLMSALQQYYVTLTR